MSVTIRYRMNHGNNMFQYMCARLLADRNDLTLESSFARPHLIWMKPQERGQRFGGDTIVLTDADDVLDRAWPPGRYVLDGYFQRSRWYHEARDEISSFAVPIEVQKRPSQDLVINLRLGRDYMELGWVIHPQWYLDIVKAEVFNQLYIVTDERDPAYLSHFDCFDPVIICSGPKGDWNALRSFDRIVCANSSFSWWAAYFSGASKIWTFTRWVPHEAPQIEAFPNGITVDGDYLEECPT